jgi:hypothetical protein
MNSIYRFALLAAGLVTHSLHAVIFFGANETLSSGNLIGEAPAAGLGRQLTINTGVIDITELNITLDISSAPGDLAWSGDLYVQLTAPSGAMAVLVNRPGQVLAPDPGYGDAGLNITIGTGGGLHDVHTYQAVSYSLNGLGQLTGTWDSDGRQDSTSGTRDRMLNQFLGQNPNGVWTLMVSDMAGGNLAQLNSWSINGVGTVPEPEAWAALAGATLVGFAALHRRKVTR